MDYWQTQNGVLISGPHEARLSPADADAGRTVYLLPAGAVTERPPHVAARQVPVWDAGAWKIVPDYRGETWWRGHAEPVTVIQVGDPAALGLVATEPPAPYVPPSADDVRAEASRRMQVLVGARDAAHLEIIIANGTREAVRLLRTQAERAWTPEEAARAATLEQLDAAIEAIRAASNALEPVPPADYADNKHWPSFGG